MCESLKQVTVKSFWVVSERNYREKQCLIGLRRLRGSVRFENLDKRHIPRRRVKWLSFELLTCALLVRQSTLNKENGTSGDTKKNGPGVFRFSRPRVHFPFQVISGEEFLRFVDLFLSETWLVHISEKVLPRGLSTSCAVFSVDPHGFYPRLTSTCFSLIHFTEFLIYLISASFVHISRNAFDETVCLKILLSIWPAFLKSNFARRQECRTNWQ